MEDEIESSDIMILADYIGQDWQKLAMTLPLHNKPVILKRKIGEIKDKNKSDTSSCCFDVVTEWMEFYPEASRKYLIDTLKKMGKNSIVSELEKNKKEQFTTGPSNSELASGLEPDQKRFKILEDQGYKNLAQPPVQAVFEDTVVADLTDMVTCRERETTDMVTCIKATQSMSSVHTLDNNVYDDDTDNETEKKLFSSSSPVIKEASYSDNHTSQYDLSLEDTPLEVLQLRPYQDELIQPAIEGHNTIVCAPTNSGKTFLAVQLVKHYLESKGSDKPVKIAFFAMTIPLLNQQNDLFRKYIGSDKCRKVFGDVNVGQKLPLKKVISKHEVILMTPQILADSLDVSLKNEKASGRSEDTLSISDFSLLILDECHHCLGGHPVNRIMDHYNNLKMGGYHGELPQVLGLSASLGTGNASLKNYEDGKNQSVNHILTLCANMDAKVVSTVTENINDLQQYISTPVQEIVKVAGRSMNDALCRVVKDKMNTIVAENLNNAGEYLNLMSVMEKETIKQKGSLAYEHWLNDLMDEVVKVIESVNREKYVTPIQYLKLFNDALIIYNDANIRDILVHLEEHCKEVGQCDYGNERTFHGYVLDILRIAKTQEGEINPKIMELKKLLQSAFKNNTNSRGIVFVRTRALVNSFVRWMTRDDDLSKLNALCFMGHASTLDSKGMTQTEQQTVMRKFKEGDCRLIVATTVAQEGIDNPKCDLIIRYDQTGNEITMMQMRGRARKPDSRVQFLTEHGSKAGEREEMNIYREALMHQAINIVQKLDANERGSRINKLQVALYTQRLISDLDIASKKQSQKIYQLKCLKCDEYLCKSSDLRIINCNQHIVLDQTFTERVSIEKHRNEGQRVAGFIKKSKMSCQKCKSNIGTEIDIDGVVYPLLKVKTRPFVLVDPNGRKERIPKKWQGIPFFVGEITEAEKLSYLQSQSDETLRKLSTD